MVHAVASLADLEALIREQPGVQDLEVVSLTMRDAEAMYDLLSCLETSYGWRVAGMDRVDNVARVDRVLLLMGEADIPMYINDRSERNLRLLITRVEEAIILAHEIDGPLVQEIKALCQLIKSMLIDDDCEEDVDVQVQRVRDAVYNLRSMVID